MSDNQLWASFWACFAAVIITIVVCVTIHQNTRTPENDVYLACVKEKGTWDTWRNGCVFPNVVIPPRNQ